MRMGRVGKTTVRDDGGSENGPFTTSSARTWLFDAGDGEASSYRYRFDKADVVRSRPGWVLMVAFLFFFTAILSTSFAVVAVIESLFINADGNSEYVGDGLRLLLSLPFFLPSVLSVLVAYGVVSGQRWARWFAIATGFAMAMFFLWSSLVEDWFVFPGILAWLGGKVLVLFLASPFLFVPIVLLNRNTREWFRFAHQLRQEHKARKKKR